MRRIGGSIALTCGILGIFAPFIDAFFALAATKDRLVIDANPYALGISAFSSVVIMLLAGTVLNRRSRIFPILVIIFSLFAAALTFGDIARALILIAGLGGLLALFGRRKTYVM